MSDLIFSIEKVAGVATDESASHIFAKRISLADGRIGTFVGCVLVAGSGEDVGIVERDMLDLATSKLEGVEDLLLENLVRVRDISMEFVEGRKLVVNFVYLFFWQDVCYVVRAGERVRVRVFDDDKSVELSFESGSGPVRAGQLYLLATEKFLADFDTSVLGQGEQIDFADVIDGLATEISAKKDQGEIAAVFVKVAAAQDIEKTEELGDPLGRRPLRQVEDEARSEASNGAEGGEDTEVNEGGFAKGASIGSITTKILAVIGREFRRLRGGEVEAKGRLRRNIVILAIGLILILAASGGYTIYKGREEKKLAEFEAHLTAASGKLNEGSAIIELNRARAREIFIEADREVKLALTIDGKSERAKSLESEINNKLKGTEISANVNFSTLSEIAGNISSLSDAGKTLIVSGTDGVFEVDRSSKSSEKVGELGADAVFVYDNRAFLLTDGAVIRLDLASLQQAELFSQSGAQDIGVFFGNVYLLSGDMIDKYVPVETGYSGPSDYLSAKEEFRPSSRFAIDGLIWVSAGNKILKFNRGGKQDFEISGVSGSVGELGIIYTSSGLDNLYVVDVTNSALLVIGRDGTYKKAYPAPEFGKASDLVVFDDESKVYISVGNKVLEASL